MSWFCLAVAVAIAILIAYCKATAHKVEESSTLHKGKQGVFNSPIRAGPLAAKLDNRQGDENYAASLPPEEEV